MNWAKVKLVWLRELRDQMRDRRTLFTVAVLPVLLYPLMGMVMLQVTQFRSAQTLRILVIGEDELPDSPPLIVNYNGERSLYGGDIIKDEDGEESDEPQLLEVIAADADEFAGLTPDEVEAIAKAGIDDGDYDAAIYFPPDFSEQLNAYRNRFRKTNIRPENAVDEVPKPFVFAKTSKDRSRIATNRINSAVQEWGATIYASTLKDIGVSISEFRPIQATTIDVAEESSIRAHMWSKILPFVLMIWALTGAFYPAIDLCAGEKERGTLETLLTSPAKRGEIVWGKLLAVTSFSMATAILNLLSLIVTGAFVMKAIGPGAMTLGPPPLAAIGWLMVALVPTALMFSALTLAIAAMARSSKEGQYYLMPLLLISMPLMIVPIMPGTQLSLGTSLVPITGLIFVLRQLIEGEYGDALRYAAPVIGVTLLCVWLSIRWAIDQFNKEEVLFRESEQFSIGIWLKHVIRNRGVTPTLGAALFVAALLLVIRFFALFALNNLFPMPQTWNTFTLSTLITLVGLIAVPAVIAAFLLTRNPWETLLLNRAPVLPIIAAFVLALCVHPVLHVLQTLVTFVFPTGPEVALLEKQMNATFAQAPGMWAVVLLIALAPAICEELAFRGFILSGLRKIGHKWAAIVLSAALFGVAHGLLQQSVMATLTGIVLGYIAVQAGSLWPCVVYHFTNNASVLLVSSVKKELLDSWPMLNWFFVPVEDGFAFASWVVVAGLVGAALILWWFARLPHQASREEQLQQAIDRQQAVA